MMVVPAILVLVLMLGGMAQTHAIFDPAYRAIFPAGRAKLLLMRSCAPVKADLPDTVSGTWTPRRADVDGLESRLPGALRTAVEKADGIGAESVAILERADSIANHARQYAGVTVNGHRRILIIAAPISHVDSDGARIDFEIQNSAWRSTRPLGVCDGGPNQFSALYDPATGNFGEFIFSGTRARHPSP